MDAGLSNLSTLKAHLLAEPIRPQNTWDDVLLTLGRGVAGGLQRACNRQFARVVGGQWTTPCSSRTVFVLPRYPLESVTSIELREHPGGGWISQDMASAVAQIDSTAGLVVLDGPLGWRNSELRFTWTGGWWWDTDEDGAGVLPAGAAPLPEDLRLAWLIQCEEVWARRDRLGMGMAMAPQERAKLSDLELVPAVQDTLRAYIRHG